ncbi:MAG: sulfite exporter TauE/SafE family protein [Bryobacterales bacterium]|nr:sulfite exporter TauE/SafE family protein [Bryobacterales bacterium]
MDLLLLAASFSIGVLIGLTSMGGAALMTPFLILVVGMKPVLAVGTDLACGAVTKLIGSLVHWRQGTVDVRLAFRAAWGSVPGGLLGVAAVTRMHRLGLDADVYLRRALGVVLVMLALMLVLKTLLGERPGGSEGREDAMRRWIPLWGAAVGFAVGFTSVGSGSLMAPVLMLIFPLMPSRAVGTDLLHATFLVSVAAFAHSSAGHVDWRLAGILLFGSVPGVLLGSLVAPRLPIRPLRLGLATVLLATGLKLA